MDRLSDVNYGRMLERAWRATYDALEMAEAQGRHQHVRKLKHACTVINEAYADLLDTQNIVTRRATAARDRALTGSIDQIHDSAISS